MNKKISTLLTAGLLVTSALCGSAWAQTPLTINGIELETVANPAAKATWKSGPYFVIADVDNDGTATASDVLLKVVASQDGKTLTYSGAPDGKCPPLLSGKSHHPGLWHLRHQ